MAEPRPHVHDVMNIIHDRGHMALLFFPLPLMKGKNICVIRLPQSCRIAIHLIKSGIPPSRWIYLAAYQEHIRVADVKSSTDGATTREGPETATNPPGRKSFLAFCSPSVSIDCRNLPRRPNFQAPRIRLPLRV